MSRRFQFSLQGLMLWVSLLAGALGVARWLAMGQLPSAQFVLSVLIGAIYGAAVLWLAKT